MDYTVELPDGSSIVMLYTKKFTWKDEEQGQDMNFEPIQGRVYRALKTVGDNNYYIHMTIPKKEGKVPVEGIRVTNLNYETPEWVCEFVELNDYNIIDFDIVSEDYEKIGKWLGNKQQDLIDRLFNPEGMDMTGSMEDKLPGQVGSFNIEDNMSAMDIVQYLQKSLIPLDNKAMESIQWISMRDPFALNGISYLLNEYVNYMKKEDESPITPLPRDIGTSEELGEAANITTIAAALNDHINNKNKGRNELFKMFVGILFELMRQDITSKTNR